MRVLFICENYYPHYGGAEVLFKNLAERYVNKGHSVTVLTHRLKGTKKWETINGVEIQRVSSFFSRYIFTFFAVPKAIKLAKKHDIIQTTNFNGAPPAWLAAKLTQKPIVITVHEVWAGKWKEITGFSWWKSKFHEILERAIYCLPYDKYIGVSDATQKDLLKIGIQTEKVTRIYNGFDYQFWNPSNFNDKNVIKLREELGLNGKWVYFSWGRPGPSKGFECLIKAAPLIKKKIPHASFLLMLGSIDTYQKNYAKIVKLIASLRLQNDIKIIPSVPYGELGYYIKAADCVLIPSISEGFGYTALEGIALGKPLVTSDAGALPEIISGKYQIFPSKNVPELAEKAIKAARKEYHHKKTRRFEWEDCVNSYIDIYTIIQRESLKNK